MYTVGLAAYNENFSNFVTAGNVLDGSAARYHPIYEEVGHYEVGELRSICGWYFAFDRF
jgi:hypothetical protein